MVISVQVIDILGLYCQIMTVDSWTLAEELCVNWKEFFTEAHAWILLYEVIRPGTKEAEGLSKSDLDKRLKVGCLSPVNFWSM